MRVILLEMVIEMALRGERAVAALALTVVWLLTCVQAHVSLQISFLKERLAASLERAYIVAHSIVLFDVHLQSLLSAVRLPAPLDRADELLLLKMSLEVILQVSLRHE